MATAQQKARARADVEAGKRIVLHATKLNVKQRARLALARAETAKNLCAWIKDQECTSTWDVKHYVVDAENGSSYVYYVKHDSGLSHTLSVDFSRQTMTLYADAAFGGRVAVCRDMESLAEALEGVCF